MSSRRFFYFLPAAIEKKLDSRNAVLILAEEGLNFDSSVFINTMDDTGVLLESKEQILDAPVEDH